MSEHTIPDQERENAQMELRDKGSRFLDYLAALAREHGSRPQQQIEKNLSYILCSQLPDTPGLFDIGPDAKSGAWLTMRQVRRPASVRIPETLKTYVDPRSVRKTTSSPRLGIKFRALKERSNDRTISADERAEASRQLMQISQMFAEWSSKTWPKWCAASKHQEQAYDLYHPSISRSRMIQIPWNWFSDMPF